MRTNQSFFLLLFSLFALNLGAQTPAQNKQNALRIIGSIDSGNVDMFSKHVHPNLKQHTTSESSAARDGKSDFEHSKSMITTMHKSFPDSKTTVEKIVAEGDIVMIYSTRTGTNKGEYMGKPATNKAVSIKQFDMIRFDASVKPWNTGAFPTTFP